MNPRRNLRLRVLVAMLLVVTVCNALFALAIFIVNERLERKLMDAHVARETEQLIQRLETGQQAPPTYDSGTKVYLRSRQATDLVPAHLAGLDAGDHHRVQLDGRSYQVGVRELDNDKIWVAVEVTDFARKRWRLGTLLVIGIVLIPLFAIWLVIWLSRRAISPVSSLAAEVSRLEPHERNIRLSPRYQGYEVEAIAQAFDRYMARLDGFLQREQSFTAAASHELRTPLSVIATSSEILESDRDLPERLEEPVARIGRAARDMAETLASLLFLAREKTGEPRAMNSQTQLEYLIPAITGRMGHLVDGKPVTLDIGLVNPATVAAPESDVALVIGNLLRNAMTYTDTGQISVQVNDRDVKIEDTGHGIDERELQHIFDRNYRGDNSKGAGLGLYITKEMCARYGWRLQLHGNKHHGTTAIVEF